MKRLLVAGLVASILFLILDKEIVASASHSIMATVKVEKFDPPARINEYNEIVRVLVMTIPDTPHLVLHIPCIRSKISPNNNMAIGSVIAPGVVEGCIWQKIPFGKYKGAYVNANGEIAATPGE